MNHDDQPCPATLDPIQLGGVHQPRQSCIVEGDHETHQSADGTNWWDDDSDDESLCGAQLEPLLGAPTLTCIVEGPHETHQSRQFRTSWWDPPTPEQLWDTHAARSGIRRSTHRVTKAALKAAFLACVAAARKTAP